MTVRLGQIARLIGAEIPAGTEDVEISGVGSIEEAGARDVSFLANPKYAGRLGKTRAAAVIVPEGVDVPAASVPLVTDEPYFAFLKVLEFFDTRLPSDIAEGIDSRAAVHPGARLGKDVSIGPFAVVGEGVEIGDGTIIGPCSVVLKNTTIGKGCVIYPNVTIMDGCEIGDGVILHSGVVVGSDGFGFVPRGGRLHKIPQTGTVKIEDDVEIQACTCIDRAAFGVTVIGKGSKLDNLVQVGHNVRIGPGTVIASQTGISGSTSIGGGVRVGGQAGFAGHLKVGDGVSVGARSGVTKDVSPGKTVSGFPARKHSRELRVEAALQELPELVKKVRELEKRIRELERLPAERKD